VPKYLAIATGLVLLGLVPARAAASSSKLVGSVGAGGSVSLRTASGAAVKTLRHGSYEIVVRDRSSRQNFHLYGPTKLSLVRPVNRKTTIAFVGTKTWTLRLRAGTYRYYSDAPGGPRKRTFRVT
jgi:hypothetical protein